METKFYYLQPGDPIEIGDQFETGAGWESLTESDYREWVSFASHYWPNKHYGMSRVRRSLNKDPKLSEKTKEIFHQVLQG